MNAIDFECPECGAKPGERCHTYTGKMQPVSHLKRKRAAFEEEMSRTAEGEGEAEGAAAAVTKTKRGSQGRSD